jgi:hypothetical protein
MMISKDNKIRKVMRWFVNDERNYQGIGVKGDEQHVQVDQ